MNIVALFQSVQESLESLQDTVDRLDSTMASSIESYTLLLNKYK